MDINKLLNSQKGLGDLSGVSSGISAGLGFAQMGIDKFIQALNYNPYKVNLENQTYTGKSILKNGGKLNKLPIKLNKKILAGGGDPIKGSPTPQYSWSSTTAPNTNVVLPKETGTTYTENRLIARPAKIKLQTSNDNLDIRTPEEWKAIDNAPNVNIPSIQSRPQNGTADYTIQEMSDWNARQELAKNIKKGVTAASFIPPLTLPALAAQTGIAANDSYRSGDYTPLATQALQLATLGAVSKIPGVNNALNSAASEVKSFANQALRAEFVNPLAGIKLEKLEAPKNLDNFLKKLDEKILKPNYLNEGVLTSAKTIEKEGRKILNDLSSKEGIRRLSNQFKKANPNLTKSELDTLVQNRLKEVESAIEYNNPRYLFQEKAKDILTPEVVREFYPKNNAYWTKNNSFIKNKNPKSNLSNISDEDIDYSIFEPDAGTKKFLDPNYSPGAITLGENLEKNIKVLDHEIGHATAKGGKLPIDDELKKLIPPGQKKSLLEKVFNPLSKESIDDKNYFDFAGYRPIENERYPFLVEQRRHMMENGILSNRYDKVTPKKLLQARISAMLDRGPNYVEGNRLIKFTPFWKYSQLADIMNQAPAALPAGLTGAGLLKAMQSVNKGEEKPQMAEGGMLRRKDGSYSRRGLWDNIRANAGSGKEPTKEMLEQEKKIKSKMALGGKLPKIHIKKENEGKFTESAKNAGMGVQEFASKVLANKEDYSTTQVKRANFARNAAQWNKAMGGILNSEEGGPEDPKNKKIVAGPTVDKTNQKQSTLITGKMPWDLPQKEPRQNWIDRNSSTIDNILNIGSLAALGGAYVYPPAAPILGPTAAWLRSLNVGKTGYDAIKAAKEGDYTEAGVQTLLGAADMLGAAGASDVFKSGSKFTKKQIQNQLDNFARAERAAGRTTNQINAGKRRLENQLKAEADLKGQKIDKVLDIVGAASDATSLVKNNYKDLIKFYNGETTKYGYLPKMQQDNTRTILPTKGSGGYLDNKSFPYGGLLKGPSHENGGINVNSKGIPTTAKNAVAEVEGGEYSYTDPVTKQTYIFSDRLPYKVNKNGKKN
jgi:hypothetical protein